MFVRLLILNLVTFFTANTAAFFIRKFWKFREIPPKSRYCRGQKVYHHVNKTPLNRPTHHMSYETSCSFPFAQ